VDVRYEEAGRMGEYREELKALSPRRSGLEILYTIVLVKTRGWSKFTYILLSTYPSSELREIEAILDASGGRLTGAKSTGVELEAAVVASELGGGVSDAIGAARETGGMTGRTRALAALAASDAEAAASSSRDTSIAGFEALATLMNVLTSVMRALAAAAKAVS
jgi:hypothetical protein